MATKNKFNPLSNKFDLVNEQSAIEVPYDNTSSGLAATETQSAIDEVKSLIPVVDSTKILGTGGSVDTEDGTYSGVISKSTTTAAEHRMGTLDTYYGGDGSGDRVVVGTAVAFSGVDSGSMAAYAFDDLTTPTKESYLNMANDYYSYSVDNIIDGTGCSENFTHEGNIDFGANGKVGTPGKFNIDLNEAAFKFNNQVAPDSGVLMSRGNSTAPHWVVMPTMTVTGSGQSITSGVDTLVTFEFFGINETGISYSAGTFTLAAIGRYRAYFQVSYDDASSVNILRQLAIRLNGGNIRLTRNDDNNGGSSAMRSYQIEAIFDTTAVNATVELYLQQNTGGSVTLVNNELTHGHITRIR